MIKRKRKWRRTRRARDEERKEKAQVSLSLVPSVYTYIYSGEEREWRRRVKWRGRN